MSIGFGRRVGRLHRLAVVAGLVAVASLARGESLAPSTRGGDHKPWGKDPFLVLHESSAKTEMGSEPRAELQGVIAGPTGVVAILNHQVVRVGDRVEGELVVEITPHAVILQRGAQVRRIGLRSLAFP